MMRLQMTTMCGRSSSVGSPAAILRLLFRTHFVGLSEKLNTAGEWALFLKLLVLMSTLIVLVASIFQRNEIADDFPFGAVVAGALNWPMTTRGRHLSVRVPDERRLPPGTVV
jgi:hypothetical protein